MTARATPKPVISQVSALCSHAVLPHMHGAREALAFLVLCTKFSKNSENKTAPLATALEFSRNTAGIERWLRVLAVHLCSKLVVSSHYLYPGGIGGGVDRDGIAGACWLLVHHTYTLVHPPTCMHIPQTCARNTLSGEGKVLNYFLP